MPEDKNKLHEPQGTEPGTDNSIGAENTNKPIGVDDEGNPIVPPNIDKRGSGSGTNDSPGAGTKKPNDTAGRP